MADEKKKPQADWQKNSGRPSNFQEKDSNLKKDGAGNLKIEGNDKRVSREDDKTIEETLNSISGEAEEE